MRMQPGAVTIAHDHDVMEEFLILAPGARSGTRLVGAMRSLASARRSVAHSGASTALAEPRRDLASIGPRAGLFRIARSARNG